MADPVSAGSPKVASPKAPAKLNASDFISKLTTAMRKSGVYWKDSKKAEPHFKKGKASKDPPIDQTDFWDPSSHDRKSTFFGSN